MRRILVLFMLLTACLLYSQDVGTVSEQVLATLDSFLSAEQRAALLEDGYIIRSIYDGQQVEPRFTPPFAVPQTFAKNWDSRKGAPTFLIEALYLHKKAKSTAKDVEKVSRIMRSISRLEGLHYYSSSRKKMRLLYESSYCIDDPHTKNRVPDPIDAHSADFSVYALQKDLTFKQNVYRYRFCADANSTGFISTNVNALKYLLFKVIAPENIEVSIAVTDLGEYLLTYALTQACFTDLPVFRNRVQSSFRTRGEALYGWFISQYEDR